MVAACAYCKSFIALREPVEDPSISHGACEACLTKLLRDFDIECGDHATEFPSVCDGVINRIQDVVAVR